MLDHAVSGPVLSFGQLLNFPKQPVGKADGDLGKGVVVVLVHASIFNGKAINVNNL
jgi:hypothetical protein